MQRFLDSRLSLRQLRAIAAIDQCGSLSRAAVSLGLTQSALSKSLHEAETILQTRVFDRSARGVVRSIHGEGPGARSEDYPCDAPAPRGRTRPQHGGFDRYRHHRGAAVSGARPAAEVSDDNRRKCPRPPGASDRGPYERPAGAAVLGRNRPHVRTDLPAGRRRRGS